MVRLKEGGFFVVYGWAVSDERLGQVVHLSVYSGSVSAGLSLNIEQAGSLIDELNSAIKAASEAVQNGIA